MRSSLQATLLNALFMPLLIGSAVSVATFWARAPSSLLCCGERLELLARMRARQLDDFRQRLCGEQFAGEIERRIGVDARRLDHLQAVVGSALGWRSSRWFPARRWPLRPRPSSSRRCPCTGQRHAPRIRGRQPAFRPSGCQTSASRISAFRTGPRAGLLVFAFGGAVVASAMILSLVLYLRLASCCWAVSRENLFLDFAARRASRSLAWQPSAA